MIAKLLMMLALAGANPDRVELKVAGRVVAVVPADVNGDGASDVLVFWREGFPPEAISRISVYLAREGRIGNKPHQIIRLSARAVAFDVGDAGADGRSDVLLLARDGVWAHVADANGRLGQEPVQVVKAMTVAAFPHEDHVPPVSLMVPLGGNRHGLLVPTVPIGPLSLYEHEPERGWRLRQVLRVPSRSNVYTSAEDFRSVRNYGASFRLTYPRWQAADQDGDGRTDLLFFSQDEVAVFRRRPNGAFPPRPDLYRSFGIVKSDERVKRSLLVRGEAGDVNGDGRADLLFNKTVGGISNMKSELRLYLADDEGRYPKGPALLSGRDGWGSSARLTDVDGDGRADLVRPHVDMGLTTLIGMMLKGRLDVSFEVFLARDGAIRERPDLVLESPLRINFSSDQELQGPYPIFREDFTGDGVRDLLLGRAGAGSGSTPDRLEVRRGRGPVAFEDEPVWHVDLPGTRFVVPFRIRPSEPPGLLVYFSLVKKLRGDVWVIHNRGGLSR